MTEVGFVLLRPFLAYLESTENVLHGCIFAIEHFYWSGNPYHSSLHAANVAHCGVALLNIIDLTKNCLDVERVVFIISAIGHDIGHPGRSNSFYVNTNNVLVSVSCNLLIWLIHAGLYSKRRNRSRRSSQHDSPDTDILLVSGESTAFLSSVIWCSAETNIFASLSRAEYIAVRKLMITFILATDMAKHFELISKSRIRRQSPEFDMRSGEIDRQYKFTPASHLSSVRKQFCRMVLTLVFKSADLGHSTLDWSQHLEWSLRLAEEYYQQVSCE